MSKTILQFSILFVVLVLAQAIMFNNICLFNLAVPFFFIYFIIRLPITLSESWALTFSFLAGLIVDIFANTQGMNALACTILSVMRKPVLHLYFSRCLYKVPVYDGGNLQYRYFPYRGVLFF